MFQIKLAPTARSLEYPKTTSSNAWATLSKVARLSALPAGKKPTTASLFEAMKLATSSAVARALEEGPRRLLTQEMIVSSVRPPYFYASDVQNSGRKMRPHNATNSVLSSDSIAEPLECWVALHTETSRDSTVLGSIHSAENNTLGLQSCGGLLVVGLEALAVS